MENNIKVSQLSIKRAELVPVDEQAVEPKQTEQPPVAVIAKPLAVENAIPEEERALSLSEVPNAYVAVRKYQNLNAVAGMANLQNVFDNRVYAALVEDKDGKKSIVFCEQYADGTFSPKMEVKQSDLYFFQSYNNPSNSYLATKIRNKVNNFVFKLAENYLATYNGNEPLDMESTLKVLLTVKDKLPRLKAQAMMGETPEQFYDAVMEQAHHVNQLGTHKAYYSFDSAGIHAIATALDMKPKELLDKLKEYGFLYLTKSSEGYKTYIRIPSDPVCEEMKGELAEDNSYTTWAYCIYKLEHIEKAMNS